MTDTHSLVLRAGTIHDLSVVDALMAAAFDPRFGEAWTRAQCQGVLAMPGVRLTLAEVDAVPAGFALVRAVLDEAELLLLAVAPAFRRCGVGRALLDAVIADCRERGGHVVHLEVRDGNPAAGLYLRSGFGKVGERRDYYRGKSGEVSDAHSYRLWLENC